VFLDEAFFCLLGDGCNFVNGASVFPKSCLVGVDEVVFLQEGLEAKVEQSFCRFGSAIGLLLAGRLGSLSFLRIGVRFSKRLELCASRCSWCVPAKDS
jgi:hypothetical protein